MTVHPGWYSHIMWTGDLTKSQLESFKAQVAFGQIVNRESTGQFQYDMKPTLTNLPAVVEAVEDAGFVLHIVDGEYNGEKVLAHRKSVLFDDGVPTEIKFVFSSSD